MQFASFLPYGHPCEEEFGTPSGGKPGNLKMCSQSLAKSEIWQIWLHFADSIFANIVGKNSTIHEQKQLTLLGSKTAAREMQPQHFLVKGPGPPSPAASSEVEVHSAVVNCSAVSESVLA